MFLCCEWNDDVNGRIVVEVEFGGVLPFPPSEPNKSGSVPTLPLSLTTL